MYVGSTVWPAFKMLSATCFKNMAALSLADVSNVAQVRGGGAGRLRGSGTPTLSTTFL